MRNLLQSSLVTLLLLTLVLTGCAGKAHPPAPAIDPAAADWATITAAARGTTVKFYMWGGSDTINRWVDGYVARRMSELYGVKVQRVPMDAPDFINKLLTEKQAGQTAGSIDLIWVNGANFKTARQGDLLWGPFAGRLPNFQAYVNAASPDVVTDFGFPVDGYEAPWGKAQFVMIYDSARVPEPPRSFAALAEWVRQNPGRFTYPAPPDFTGSAFTRMALYETTGGFAQYLTTYDEARLTQRWQPAWDLLTGMAPHLWLQGETYPETLARLHQLYADGEVWFSMSYDPAEASNMILKGAWPETTRTYLLDAGTIGNTHFTAVPFNAPNKPGAMLLADFLLSPEAQINKQDPHQWGDFVAIDPQKLPDADRQKLAGLARGPATLSPAELSARRVPELAPEYVGKLEAGWREQVARRAR
ncbi:MAG TPA: ABC transporter substrate-binding protein [Symbiobacteriaceae bacterium]|nr:ABC transporter substrate-binding protein [Symbiobacteriaceae bacterium]